MEGYDIIEAALKSSTNPKQCQEFPFSMSFEDGQIYRKGLAAAYQHALEMLPRLSDQERTYIKQRKEIDGWNAQGSI